MSFEDDMIEDGFRDEQEYLDHLCDEAERYYYNDLYSHEDHDEDGNWENE